MKENEQICEARSLLFSSARKVRNFLEKGANAALLENAVFVKVSGVHREGGDGPMDIFAVLLGAARYVKDPRDVGRKYSNCIVEANPHAGPNDGFLVLRAKSHNGCGVTEGTELVCDFEDAYLDGLPMAPAPKKVRGALDLLIERQRKGSAKETILVEEDQAKASQEEKAQQEEKATALREAKKKEKEEEAKAKKKEKEEEAKRKEKEEEAKRKEKEEEAQREEEEEEKTR